MVGSLGKLGSANGWSAVVSALGGVNRDDKTLTRSAIGDNIALETKTHEIPTALSRDTEHSNAKVQQYDKAEYEERLETAQLIGDISQNQIDIQWTPKVREAEATKAQAEAVLNNQNATTAEKAEARQIKSQSEQIIATYGKGGDYQLAVRAVTGVLQGLATGNQNAAWVNGLSPYANNLIKTYTTDESGQVNTTANLMAHAMLGALEAYAIGNHAEVGAAGAITSEVAAKLITEQLYHTEPDKLTDDQKQVVATLSQVTAGLAGIVTSDSTQSAVSAAEIGKRAVENNYLFRQEAEEKAVLERKVRLGTATEEEENRLAQINLIDQIRDNEIMAACSQGVSSDSCQSLVQEANYAQYGYEQNLAYNLKFKELYRQDYENVQNILRGKDKDSIDFEKMALSLSKSQNISLDEAKSTLSKIMVYKEFADLVGMVRAGTAVKYGVKSDNFATQVPSEMNANSKLSVVGNTGGMGIRLRYYLMS
ncbi:VENN motif pre-toxin domain-containing protein [Exercitatus varius]|uniref:VENN motif pre-toxin domain-containing protein n=1 Tax=Exercitatus varius TaxID=67857 RepID=UPI00294AC505|nr:VENN motif pre-toxin domain-containing protein [Exercitatus varius]